MNMDISKEIESLRDENRILDLTVRTLSRRFYSFACCCLCLVSVTVLAAANALPKPGPVTTTKLILVDADGKTKVVLEPEVEGFSFNIQTPDGKKIARIGEHNNAGPSTQYFWDGKQVASYSYMNLSLQHKDAKGTQVYVGVPSAGAVGMPQIELTNHDGTGKAYLRTDDKGAQFWLADKDGKIYFKQPEDGTGLALPKHIEFTKEGVTIKDAAGNPRLSLGVDMNNRSYVHVRGNKLVPSVGLTITEKGTGDLTFFDAAGNEQLRFGTTDKGIPDVAFRKGVANLYESDVNLFKSSINSK